MRHYWLPILILLGGCTTEVTPEGEREIVLKYVATDVGTVGPFNKNRKQELNILAEKDRAAAAALLDHGAVGFVVYPRASDAASSPTQVRPGTRIILVQHERVVGDFRVP